MCQEVPAHQLMLMGHQDSVLPHLDYTAVMDKAQFSQSDFFLAGSSGLW